MTDTRISDAENWTIKIYCMSSTSRLPVFPERLSAIRAFATVKRGRKRGETGQTGGVSTVKQSAKCQWVKGLYGPKSGFDLLV